MPMQHLHPQFSSYSLLELGRTRHRHLYSEAHDLSRSPRDLRLRSCSSHAIAFGQSDVSLKRSSFSGKSLWHASGWTYKNNWFGEGRLRAFTLRTSIVIRCVAAPDVEELAEKDAPPLFRVMLVSRASQPVSNHKGAINAWVLLVDRAWRSAKAEFANGWESSTPI